MFIEMLGAESPVPEAYAELFGHGTTARVDPDAYPAPAEVRVAMNEAYDALAAALAALTPEQLAAPVGGPLEDECPTRAHIPAFCLFHDGFHFGQVASVRRSLGMPFLMN